MNQVLAFSAWICLGGLACAQPVKLDVQVPSGSIAPGAKANIVVELRDANNKPSPARKAMQLVVKARLPSGEEKAVATATVSAGQTSVSVSVPGLDKDGVAYVWATNPEVRPGGGYLRVKSISRGVAIKGAISPGKAVAPIVLPTVPLNNAKMFQKAKIGQATKMKPGIAIIAKGVVHPGVVMPPAQPAPAPVPPPDPPSQAKYQLELGLSPQGSFLADGKDPATIHAFVYSNDGSPVPEFKLIFKDGSGRMNPRPLLIREGQEEGTATLTYNRVGDVNVEYLTSTPLAHAAERSLSIHFGPPITKQLMSGPETMSFLDTAEIGVSLADENGITTDTDVDREATLFISGQGTLSEPKATIKAGAHTATVTFAPQSWGTVVIASKIDQLSDATKSIDVDPPYRLLGLAGVGGLMGGLIFILRNREAPKWRIPVGAVTGLMLVWAMLMLGMNVLPRAIVLNPLSLVMIATLGGWAGTELFDPLLKKLGFGGAPPEKKS